MICVSKVRTGALKYAKNYEKPPSGMKFPEGTKKESQFTDSFCRGILYCVLLSLCLNKTNHRIERY